MAENVWATLKTSVLRPGGSGPPGVGAGLKVGDCTGALGYVPSVEFEMNLLNKSAAEEPDAA
jgi:hypothetical protein